MKQRYGKTIESRKNTLSDSDDISNYTICSINQIILSKDTSGLQNEDYAQLYRILAAVELKYNLSNLVTANTLIRKALHCTLFL